MDKLQTHTQSHTLEGFTPVISGTGPGTGTGAPHPTLHIRESDRHSRVIGECCTSRLSHRWVWRSDKRYAGIYGTYLYKKVPSAKPASGVWRGASMPGARWVWPWAAGGGSLFTHGVTVNTGYRLLAPVGARR